MSVFTTPLQVRHHDDNTWTLVAPFSYDVGCEGSGETISVPAGFRTDFASVPRALWWLYNPTGRWGKAAVIHDWLYHNAGLPIVVGRNVYRQPRSVIYTRREADRIFLEGMRVLRVRWSARRTMYTAVRLGGRWPWEWHFARNTVARKVVERRGPSRLGGARETN